MNLLIRFLATCIFLILLTNKISIAQEHQKKWQWIKQIGGSGWDMSNGLVIDVNDNIYVAGGFTGDIMNKKKKKEGNGNRDIYVARYNSQGQMKWFWQAGGPYMDKITAIHNAPDNDLYIVGQVQGEMKIGKQQLDGKDKKLIIARINKRGKSDWVYTLPYSGAASAFLIDTDLYNNITISGFFTDTLKHKDGLLLSNGHQDIFLLKLNEFGECLNIKQIGTKGFEKPTAFATDQSGNSYLSINYDCDINLKSLSITKRYDKQGNNLALLKLDSLFQPLWAKEIYSPAYINVSGISINHQSQLFLCGNFNSQLEIDSLKYPTKGLGDIFMAKLDTVGTVKWFNTYGGKYTDRINHMRLNNLGGTMITGVYNDSIKFDSTIIKSKSTHSNAFIAQTDSSGIITWVGSMNGDQSNMAEGCELDSNGNIYFSGSFKGEIDAGEQQLTSMGDVDVFVVKYFNCQPDENLIMSPPYVCENSSIALSIGRGYTHVVWNDSIFNKREIIVDQPGEYRVSVVDKRGCVIKDSVIVNKVRASDFTLGQDTSILVGESLELQGPDMMYSYKWQDGSNLQTLLTSNPDQLTGVFKYSLTVIDSMGCYSNDSIKVTYFKLPEYANLSLGEKMISIYPIPVNDILHWSLKVQNDVTFDIQVVNVAGKLFLQKKIDRYQPGQVLTIDVSKLSSGNYYFNIISDDHSLTKKFVKK